MCADFEQALQRPIETARTSRDMSGLTRHRSDEDSGSIHADQEHGVLINDVGGKLKCICRSDLQIECGGVGLRTVTTEGDTAAEGNVEELPAGRKFVEVYFAGKVAGGSEAELTDKILRVRACTAPTECIVTS